MPRLCTPFCTDTAIHDVSLSHMFLLQLRRSKHKKVRTNAYLFLTQTDSMQIFGEIPFMKPQNDT